jgi:hypothetical protein
MLVANGIVAGTWSAAFFVALPLAITQQRVGGDGGADIGTYGLLLTCYGVANLAANVAVGSAGVPSRPGATVFLGLSLTGSGILFIACALAAPLPAGWRLPLLALATAFSGIGGPLKDITIATVRQLSVASRDMAAAMRVHLLLAYAGTLAVMLATPSLCDRLGAVTVIALVGGVFLAVAAIGWAQPSVRESRS